MEPLAPGTEDEPPVSFSSSTKQEKERERLLALKAYLPNGSYGNVYEFKYINGAEHWYCFACACPVMGWVFHHETGKRHTQALQNYNKDRFPPFQEEEEAVPIQIAPGEPIPPGFEGQVEKIALIQERLDVFTVGPLVALEYLLELRDYDPSKEPTYLCILCDKKGDPRTVLTHLASYKHILQYLQKHFPTCYRGLAPYMTKQYKRNWQSALHEIAEAIEKKFGRLKPIPVDADKYEKDRVFYLEHIAKGRHFSELSGFTFEELVNKDELTKVHEDESDKYGYNKSLLPSSGTRKKSPSPPVVANPIKKVKHSSSAALSSAVGRRRSLSSVSSITSSDLSDFEAVPKEKKKVYRRSRSPMFRNRSRSRSPYSRRYERKVSPPARREIYRERERERDLLPWEKTNYRRQKQELAAAERTRKQEKIEEYKKLCKAIDNDMERILKNHKKNPEKHPQYNEEWKKFWNKRYKELQSESKDAATHDFKPEWIEFWNKRMGEIHADEVKIKKDALRKRLGLPEEPAPISFKIGGKKKYDPNSKSAVGSSSSAQNDGDEVIVIDDRDDESKSSRRSHSPWEDEPVNKRVSRDKSRSKEREREYRKYSSRDRSYERERDYRYKEREREYRPRERIRTTADLPWERDFYKNDIPSCYKPPSVMRDVTREPVHSPGKPPGAKQAQIEEIDDGEVNVVAVLRLLTALEEKLGSLGPKVIDLLAQALGMEKAEANSSENLLDNDINCVLFETVKEKLKGQLLAGLVEPIQEKAFKNAIKKTASLIHAAGERKKEKERRQPKVDPVKVPGVGTVDKAAIAKQIANALVLQGKTDVTQAELEQLINAVVGMAEASKNSSKPITTANFLDQISKAGGSASREKSPPVQAPPPPPVVHVEEKSEEVRAEKPAAAAAGTATATNMEGLSDSDLQTLLQNFKDLSTEEQHGLINYLKKLEASEPDRVERLRKFVNLGGPKPNIPLPPPAPVVEQHHQQVPVVVKKEKSPFSNRMGLGTNPSLEEKRFRVKTDVDEEKDDVKNMLKLLPIDSDEEDYTFDDVVKAASKNVKEKELEKEREIVEESIKIKKEKEEINLDETKALINNIMNNINSSSSSSSSSKINVSADLARTLNSIPVNMANLADIVGSVQSLTNKNAAAVATAKSGVSAAAATVGQRPYAQAAYNQFYPQQQQQRQQFDYASRGSNVSYPIENKVSYPNYAPGGYSQQQSDFGRPRMNPQQHQQLPLPYNLPPASSASNNSNLHASRNSSSNNNNSNYNNRW